MKLSEYVKKRAEESAEQMREAEKLKTQLAEIEEAYDGEQ